MRHAPDGPRRSKSRWIKHVDLAIRLLGLQERGRRNALDPHLTRLEMTLPGLPRALDGYRILQVSDPHLDLLPELAETARALLAGVAADLIVVTGDIRAELSGPIDRSLRLLLSALDGLDSAGPRFAVLGNHDPAAMVEGLEAAGITVLINETVRVAHGDAEFTLTGLDDVHTFYTEAALHALDRGADGFAIALVHSAEMADFAASAGYDLYLCGHTHGGQICLPGGRLLAPSLTRCKDFHKGAWYCGDMIGYTTTGLGVSRPAVRFNCRGEVAVITLRSTTRPGPGTSNVIQSVRGAS